MAKKKAQEQKQGCSTWFASTPGQEGREQTLKLIRKQCANFVDGVHVFDVPTDMKFGSFNDLIQNLDEMSKQEIVMDSVVRRIQRQATELNPEAEFKVTWQRQSISVEDYIKRFQWDEARYPKNRNVKEILETLIQQVHRLDEDIKSKLIQYNDTKSAHQSLDKKSDGNLVQMDLTDVFGELADSSILINTENLKSIPVIVPKAISATFLTSYSNPEICPGVVPESAHLHDKATDASGNQLYTVVLMKRNQEQFFSAMRKLKCTAREFTFLPTGYNDRSKKRAELSAERSRQEQYLARVCVASFSDIFMAIVHLKALKIFVDSVLRLGVPVSFNAYSIFPLGGEKNNTKLWNEMNKCMSGEREAADLIRLEI